MERLHPGVYIQEVPASVQPIEGVSTSTTAFVGKTQKGRLDGADLVTNFTEFQSTYGGFLNDSFVAHAALQYFNNGGKRLYVARVVTSAQDPGHAAATASVTLADRQTPPASALAVSAQSPGSWANDVAITIGAPTLDPANQFKLTVSQGGNVVEVFDNLTVNPDASNAVEAAINGRSRYIQVAASNNSNTVAATSTSGDNPATKLDDAARRSLIIEVNSDGPRTIALSGPLTTGAEIATAIANAVKTLPPLRLPADTTAYSGFTASFQDGHYVLTSGKAGKSSAVRVTSAASAINAAGLLKLGLASGGKEITGAATLLPAIGAFALSGAATGGGVVASTNGLDGDTPSAADLIAGLAKLDPIADVNLVAIPGGGTTAIVDAGTSYCALRGDCFFIGEAARTDDTPEKAQAFITALTVKSSYAAAYVPWVKATDPTGRSPTPILVPPSGYVAGIYARIDGRRGVWKAPAGTEANLLGTIGLATQINDAQQDTLNPIGANAIRVFPSSGVVIWGARTLATLSDPAYRYIPVRRLAIFLERSIFNGIQWAVFEPNDEDLWASLRLNVGAFMMNMFRAGAFQGNVASQAFFVKCDAETNPQSEIDAGVVNVLIGFAPLRPAEFVVIKITQKAGDAAT